MLHYTEHYIENQIDKIFNILSVQSFIKNEQHQKDKMHVIYMKCLVYCLLISMNYTSKVNKMDAC